MEEQLHTLRNGIGHGTLRQFYTEIGTKLTEQGYEVDLGENTLTCYSVRKEGGFLGIGARTVREPVLQVIKDGTEVQIREDKRDDEFVQLLLSLLTQH